MAQGDVSFRIVQANDPKMFAQECEKAINDNYIFVSQMVITGLGKGKFMYSQQWLKKEGEEAKDQIADTQ